MNNFSVLFLLALAVATATRLWLARRHVLHIHEHRAGVPAEFANEITLEAHQKAADYSSAKTRFGIAHTLVDSGMLLVLTFGGLLQLLDGWAGKWFSGDILHGTALIALFAVVTSLVDLPFTWYRTFNIEARFGFNKMTFGMWLADIVKSAAVGAAFGLPLVLAVLWLMGEMGDWWWL